jgi:hypothetical protein
MSRKTPPAEALAAIGARWTIEISFTGFSTSTWTRTARARCDNAPLNLALLRWIASNWLRANRDEGSIRGKIKRAAWDDR